MTNPYLEKRASLIGGAALTHLAQNVATNQALHSKGVAKYLANSFTQGYHGVVDTSLAGKAKRSLASILTPDVAAAHKASHEAGSALRETLHGATNRQRAAARMLVEGRFGALHKHNMHNDPVVKKVHEALSKHIPTLKNYDQKVDANLVKLWNDKSHPLLSNIAKNIGRGEVPKGAHFKPGSLNQTLPALSSLSVAPIEPSAALLDGAKALAGSKAVQGNKYGKKAVDFLQKTFITDPLKKGSEATSEIKGMGHQASKFLMNPTSAHLKRTAAAIKQTAEI